MRSLQDIVDAEFAEQEARNMAKLRARTLGVVVEDRRDAAVELAALGMPAVPPPGGWVSPVVDVNRTPLRPVAESAPHPVKPVAYCKYCGKLFTAKTVQAAKMMKGRHEKREHAGQSATAP